MRPPRLSSFDEVDAVALEAAPPGPARALRHRGRFGFMAWMPLSRDDLDSMIATALADYDEEVRAAWAGIRIEPTKWRCSPWGDEGGGFWVVAIEGDRVLWFNDIEDGFNRSTFSEHGVIDEYRCDQTELTEILSQIACDYSARVWKELHEHDVPAELAGPGTIVRRQTTYWELRAAAEVQYRVHLRDKVEVGFAAEVYPRVELVSRHPLLAQHDEPSRSSVLHRGASRSPKSCGDPRWRSPCGLGRLAGPFGLRGPCRGHVAHWPRFAHERPRVGVRHHCRKPRRHGRAYVHPGQCGSKPGLPCASPRAQLRNRTRICLRTPRRIVTGDQRIHGTSRGELAVGPARQSATACAVSERAALSMITVSDAVPVDGAVAQVVCADLA